MSISSKEFLESPAGKMLPNWMREHPVLTSNNKINKIFPYLGLKNDIIKDFTIINGVSHSLVFSSTGIQGLWDIATMSMRGVCSCMHWENPHSVHVLGSIVDPVVGIAYLTDGTKTKYGLSINKRVTVRAIFAPSCKEDYELGKGLSIHIDRFYTKTLNVNPRVYDNKDPNPQPIVKLIYDYIKSKVKIPVIDAYYNNKDVYWNIPKHSIVSSFVDTKYLSFCDSEIPYYASTFSKKLFDDANL